MDSIKDAVGPVLAQARGALSRSSRSSVPALPVSTTSAPRYFDRWTDVEARRLFSAWKPDNGPQAIVRALEVKERAALTARAKELRDGLCGYLPNERDEVEASLAGMFSGFRNMRQEGDAAEAMVGVTAAVLREFPAWAISKTCMKIAQNDAGLDPRWPPNDTQIHGVVADIVREYRVTLSNIDALLSAPVEDRRPLPGPKLQPNHTEMQPVGGEPNAPIVDRRPYDGKHAQRVAAELRARKKAEQYLSDQIKARAEA